MDGLKKHILLNSGFQIPTVGLGTFKAAPGEVTNAVVWALDVGYRHIDCASVYGNETEVGAGLNKLISSKQIERADIFVTSKLWCDSCRPQDVRPACEASLRKLGLSYLDLYLVHSPTAFRLKPGHSGIVIYDDVKIEDTWRAMEGLVEAGLVRSIGVSNYNEAQIERILKTCKIKPAMNQVEVTVNFLNEKMVQFAHSHEINITAYSPFGSPAVMAGASIPSPLNEEYVNKIATAHNKTAAQVLVRHALQRGLIVIPKSVNKDRIKANYDVWDFELTNEEMKILNTSGRNCRLFTIEGFENHPEFPFEKSS